MRNSQVTLDIGGINLGRIPDSPLGCLGLSVGLFQCGVGGHGYRAGPAMALTLVEELVRHHSVVVTALDPAHRSLQ